MNWYIGQPCVFIKDGIFGIYKKGQDVIIKEPIKEKQV